MCGQRGISLLELLISVAILAVVAVQGVPTLQAGMQRAARVSASFDILGSLRLARAAASRDAGAVLVCGTDGGQRHCVGRGQRWQAVVAFRDRDGDGQLGAADEVLRAGTPLPRRVHVSANQAVLQVREPGRIGVGGTVRICQSGGVGSAVVLRLTGQAYIREGCA